MHDSAERTPVIAPKAPKLADAHYEAAARDWLRARGDAVTPEAVARIAREIRAEHEASARDAQARRVENEKMSAGNRKARRAAYARARRAGA